MRSSLATSATVEGDATAHYIAQVAKENGIGASRIAHGVPVGGELEYVDGGTLSPRNARTHRAITASCLFLIAIGRVLLRSAVSGCLRRITVVQDFEVALAS